jgi:hypothetical protein
VVGFPTRLNLPTVCAQRFFEVPPDVLDRMEMVGLPSGLRIDCLERRGEAVRGIGKRGSAMEPEVFSLEFITI